MDSPPDHPADEFRNWLELPRDVTVSILLRLGAVEILTSAQRVCSPWRKLCKDPSMWRAVDMRNPNNKWEDYELEYWMCRDAVDMRNPDKKWEDYELEWMCRDAVDRSCGQLVDINLENFGTDELLRHIADSSSQLKRLGLVRCFSISDKGLSGVAAKLPLLEELAISYCSLSKEALEAVGRCCPLLKSLNFNIRWHMRNGDYDGEAVAIAENMSELRRLQLFGNKVTNEGLQAILDSCPHLESLDLRRCLNLTLAGDLGRRCAQQIKHLRLPHDSTDDYEFNDSCSFVDVSGGSVVSYDDYDYEEYGHVDIEYFEPYDHPDNQ